MRVPPIAMLCSRASAHIPYILMKRHVLIIGGGVIGLSIARELHKNGLDRITLVEKGVCGEESSWAAAGMLGPQAEADAPGPFFDVCCASRDLYPDLAA